MKKFFVTVCLLLSSIIAFGASQTIPVYKEPKSGSKEVGFVDPSKGVIPIFTKDEWTKVGNPENGDVGWVSNKTLQKGNINFIKTTTKHTKTPNKEEHSQIFQLKQFPKLTDDDVDDMMTSFQKNKKNMQENMHDFQKLMDRIFEQSDASFEALLRSIQDFSENKRESTSSPNN